MHENAEEVAQIEKILQDGDLEALVGRLESVVFEAKSRDVYDPTNAEDRSEMAKDVSALANDDGGFLVIGARTKREASTCEDRVVALERISESAFQGSAYRGIIADLIHGTIAGLDVRWVGDAKEPSIGVGVIYVPRQSEERKPFLVAQVGVDGKKRGAVFGIFTRRGSDNVPHTVEQLRRAVRIGASEPSRRLTRIEESMARIEEGLEEAREERLRSASDGVAEDATLLRPPKQDSLGAAINRIMES